MTGTGVLYPFGSVPTEAARGTSFSVNLYHAVSYNSAMRDVKEIANQVLVKVAISLSGLRRVSSGLVRRKGLRGGIDLAAGAYRRKPLMSLGPAIDASAAARTQPVGAVSIQELSGMSPRDVIQRQGPILTGGGRRGSFTGLSKFMRKHDAPISTPTTPRGQEILNRTGMLHEGLELQALGKGKTIAQRSANWGQPVAPTVAESGVAGYGHVSPSVVLRERNILNTLPKSRGAAEATKTISEIRNLEGSAPHIESVIGRALPYGQGQGRLSRHAIRRIEQLMRQTPAY